MPGLRQPRVPLWRRAVLALLNVRVVYRPETLTALARGRAILVCRQHRSLADGPIVALASPFPLCFAITYNHAVENRFTVAGLAMLKRLGLGEREAINAAHPFSIRALRQRLRAGQSVMIFPEGRIAHPSECLDDMAGYRWLAESLGAQVVELELRGNEGSWLFAPAGRQLRPRVTLTF